MRLADFIEQNLEEILVHWTDFAATSGPAGRAMDHSGLRDHAFAMLKDMVSDLRTPQSADEQSEKSKGNAPVITGHEQTAAEVHGAGRAEDGFTVSEMVSEYRALRASVIRLWTKNCGVLHEDDLQDLMRFNEAIDQSLAEAVERFSGDMRNARDMVIAILGHDLRTPLGAIVTASDFMIEDGGLDGTNLSMTVLIRSR